MKMLVGKNPLKKQLSIDSQNPVYQKITKGCY